MPTVWVSEEKQ